MYLKMCLFGDGTLEQVIEVKFNMTGGFIRRDWDTTTETIRNNHKESKKAATCKLRRETSEETKRATS